MNPHDGSVERWGPIPTPSRETVVRYRGELLFPAGREVWRSDGTPRGTRRVVRSERFTFEQLLVAGDQVYAAGKPVGTTSELVRIDVDAGTHEVVHGFVRIDGPLAAVGGEVWVSAYDGSNTHIYRRLPSGELQIVFTGRQTEGFAGIFEVAGRSVLVMDGGLYRVDGGDLEPIASPLRISYGDPIAQMAGGRLWVRADDWVVSTDGTDAGTRAFSAVGRAWRSVFAALGPDRCLTGGRGALSLYDRDGVVIAGGVGLGFEDAALDHWVPAPGAVFAVLTDGEPLQPGEDGWPGLRALRHRLVHLDAEDGALRDLVVTSTLVATEPRVLAGEDGEVWFAEHRAGEPLVLHRFTARGDRVGAPIPVEDTQLERADLQPYGVLESGEVVATLRSGFGRFRELQVVDPETHALVLGTEHEPLGVVGRDLYFGRSDLERGEQVWRFRVGDGPRLLRSFSGGLASQPGFEGRPLLQRYFRSYENGDWFQVLSDGQVAPVFTDITDEEPQNPNARPNVIPRPDGLWAFLVERDVKQRLLRWDFVRRESVEMWTGPDEGGLRLAGRAPTAWRLDRLSDDEMGFVRLDGRAPLPDADFVLPLPRGALDFHPGRHASFIFSLGRLFALDDERAVRVEGLTEPALPFVETETGTWFVGERDGPAPVGGEPFLVRDGVATLVKDIWPGHLGSAPTAITALRDGDGVVFHAESPEHGRELWVSDGLPSGTRRVCDFRPGPASGIPPGASLAVGPRGAYVPAFVDGVGTVIVEVPPEILRGEVPCRLDPSIAPFSDPTSDEAGPLRPAGSGCRCLNRHARGPFGAAVALALCGALLFRPSRRGARDPRPPSRGRPSKTAS